ncbi:twin-arginine translocation signal domain-containing protein [Streptomyces sp. NBC_01320]|nr:hypothetical protein OG395_04475 [Streptomyces sp. NBC_01320]
MAHHPTRRSVLKWSAVTAAAAWLAPALPAALANAATGTTGASARRATG